MWNAALVMVARSWEQALAFASETAAGTQRCELISVPLQPKSET